MINLKVDMAVAQEVVTTTNVREAKKARTEAMETMTIQGQDPQHRTIISNKGVTRTTDGES